MHEPLPDPAKYMRLLEVLDDNYSKSIKVRCKLTTWPIDSMPPYHAISYTWGDPKSNTQILMNNKTLEVRTNCEFALKQAYWYRKSRSYFYRKRQSHLYRETKSEWYTKSRYFWLDALCIDQSNLNEKSKQVAMMGSIYKKASHVLACIGDHADDSLFFFESLYGLAHYLVRPRNMLKYREKDAGGTAVRFRILHRHSSIHRFALALARLAVRPYFTRIWILQELQLAQHLTILCGQYVLTKDDALCLFGGLVGNLQSIVGLEKSNLIMRTPYIDGLNYKFLRRNVNHGFPHPAWHGSWLRELPKPAMATIAMLKQNYANVKDNIFQLLSEVLYHLQCQDPRDKAYGIISLIDWGDVAPLEPDYTQNDLEVAVKFIEAIMKLGEARELGEPMWRYVVLVVKLFNLNIKSPGLAEALKARRHSMEYCAIEEHVTNECEMETAMIGLAGPKIGLESVGWCLSPEDVDRNISKLRDLEATPPQYPDDDVLYLPRWARANDWVIELNTQTPHDLWYGPSDPQYQLEPTYVPLLVVGNGIEGHRKATIGYGFYSPLKKFHAPGFKQDESAKVYVYFDIEDSIIFLWKMKQLYELHPDSKDWMVDFLDTDVSKKQTHGLSFVALPSEPPRRNTRVKSKFSDDRFWKARGTLKMLRHHYKVLFDTKTRRGWFVNDEVVALELLCAYLKNTPQTEPFDLSKLNYIEDRSSRRAFKVLDDVDNLRIPIQRVLKDVGETPGDDQLFKGQAKVERKLIVDVLRDIYRILLTLNPLKPFPGDMNRFAMFPLLHNPFKRRRNVLAKGWDFERIYRTNKAKVYTHVFDKDPGWLEFSRDAEAGIIFGSGLGEMILPRDEDCCPYFRVLPEGQDCLAIGMDRVQAFVDEWTQDDEKDKTVARLSHWYAWERGVEPFGHLHGHSEHLEQIDCSCFPVQRLVKVPHHDEGKDTAILKKRNRELYSSQEVEDMNVAIQADIKRPADSDEFKFKTNGKPRKTGVVVFGNQPNTEKLKQLAQTNHLEVQFRETAETKRNSHCSALSMASALVSSTRLMRAADTRSSRWTGEEFPTLPGISRYMWE